jgi:hypothetical protein
LKIPTNALIAPEKLTHYLLLPRDEDDKSRFLAQAAFTQQNPSDLETALRALIATEEAVEDRIDRYGTFYRVRGELHGPTGTLDVVTIWLREAESGRFRFITLKPWR